MTQVAEVLAWKFPGVEGIETRDGVLTAFPGNREAWPTDAELAAWTAEYETGKADRDRQAVRAQMKTLLAVRPDAISKAIMAFILELIRELRLIKAGTPLPSRTIPELLRDVIARIDRGEVD